MNNGIQKEQEGNMKSIINAYLIGLGAYYCITTIWRLIDLWKGHLRIRWIQKSGINALKLYDMQYGREKRGFFLAMLIGILVVVLGIFCSRRIFADLNTAYWSLSVYLILGILCMIIDLCMLLLIRKYGEFAYLTNSSLATMEGDFRKEKYRFTLDVEVQNGNTGDKYLNVYKGKNETPWRYKLIEKEEEVERVIKEFYI